MPTEWDSIWPDLIRGIPAAAVALIIGLVAAGIAWRQYRVAQAKLNLDLFEHRYAVYMTVWTYLSLASDGRADEVERSFLDVVPKTYFLFGREIGDWLVLMNAHTNALDGAKRRSDGKWETAETQVDMARRHDEHKQLLEAEVRDLRERFAKYMDFSEWRSLRSPAQQALDNLAALRATEGGRHESLRP